MEFQHRFNSGSKRRHYFHDRLVIYRLIFVTSLFWIMVDLCILAYLINESSLKVEIKSSDFSFPKSLLGRKDNEYLNYQIEGVNVGTIQDLETTKSEDSTQTAIEESSGEEDMVLTDQPAEAISGEYFVEDYSSVVTNPLDWPGEQGRGVSIPDELKELENKRFKENQFNILVSDLIALNRSLPDQRNEKCKNRKFSSNLPTTSIVIVFHNEGNSTLLRGLTSLVNRTPRKLLEEIILVDDASEKRDYLHEDLDRFVKTLPVPVLIFRNEKRMGLMRSRLRGAEAASGETLTFLDAHIEASHGWLPPLLTEIKKNRKVVICPIIDVISDKDFGYLMGSDRVYGGFDHNFVFDWRPVAERERIRRNFDDSSPMRSPTMAGGLFSIDRNYFYELGSYDDGMDIWGAENLEMSFRIWMCGGTLLIHPCSHVGHIFRSKSPYTFPGGASQVVFKNERRVIDVWTDDYRDYFYKILPGLAQVEAGDLTQRINLRRQLKCKSFRWYLDNIFPEAPVPREFFYVGQFKNFEIDYCLDSMGQPEKNSVPGAFQCHDQGGISQVFVYSKQLNIANGDFCLDLEKKNLPIAVKFSRCNGEKLSQKWTYNKKSKQFVNKEANSCLAMNKFNRNALIVIRCDSNNPLQRWYLINSLLKTEEFQYFPDK